MTQFSRHLSELVVTREVMSGNRQKANYEQGPTERCTVCHTVYPQCDTCSKYGRRGMHSLDQDKFRNAHDNPGFTDDSGALQSHWMKKDKKVPTNYILHFTDKLISSMLFFRAFLLTLFRTNARVYLGKLPHHERDPFSPDPGSLTIGQTESVVLCHCSCIRKPKKLD